MFRKIAAAAALSAALAVPAVAQDRTPAPDGAAVYIVSPAHGETVPSPVTVVFGLSGMGVAPAGIEKAKTGHHHLLIDIDPSDVDMDYGIPADDNHVHFGGGQTQVTKEMAPGKHRLTLLLGDHNHVPHDPPVMSQTIEITVK